MTIGDDRFEDPTWVLHVEAEAGKPVGEIFSNRFAKRKSSFGVLVNSQGIFLIESSNFWRVVNVCVFSPFLGEKES